MPKTNPEPKTETLAETESYLAWKAEEPDGETTYHLELNNVTVHFFKEEWDEFLELAHSLNSLPMTQNNAITDIPGIEVGQAQDDEALTGCTVVLCRKGAVGGVDVRGSAPGTRETDLLDPVNLVDKVHAVVLAGGSAFGLDAASGVMKYLAEQKIGYGLGAEPSPIVPAAILFDLDLGKSTRHPDAEMGYAAAAGSQCRASGRGECRRGDGGNRGRSSAWPGR